VTPGFFSALAASLALVSSPCVLTAPESSARGGRPQLSGNEQVLYSPDGFFALHYTLEGADRLQSLVDEDQDGQPDVLDRVLAGLALGRQSFVARGYRDLVRDGGGGGGPELDVYLVDLANNGFANAVPAELEAEPWSCFIRLAVDLTSSSAGLLESVAAHELNHCVQYRYTTNAATWIYESAATYEQYLLYGEGLLEAALQVLWGTRLSGSARPIDDVGERFEYAGLLWWKFWNEFQASGERMVPLWEQLSLEPDWTLTLAQEAARLWGLDLAGLYLEHVTWNGFACGRDDGGHYWSGSMPCLLETIAVPVEPLTVEAEFELQLEGGYTAAFWQLDAADQLLSPQLSCDLAGDQSQLGLRLVAVDAFGRRAEERSSWATSGEVLELRLDQPLALGGSALLVAASVGQGGAELRCRASWVEPLPESAEEPQGSGCSCVLSSQPWPPSSWWLLAGLALIGLLRRQPADSS
tara:strand:- start:2078 stop:3484 length:1407 start_codon:yes stop_codon:yes gene_type:complete